MVKYETCRELKNYPSAMTVIDVAEILSICKKTAYKLISNGDIPSIRVGRQIRVSKGDMYAFLKKTHFHNCV